MPAEATLRRSSGALGCGQHPAAMRGLEVVRGALEVAPGAGCQAKAHAHVKKGTNR